MKLAVAAAAALVLLAVVARASSNGGKAKVNPVEKVLQLISGLQTKIIAEGGEQQKIYNEFAEACEDRSKDLQFEIKTGRQQVEELKATMEKADADIGALTDKVQDLSGEISADEKAVKEATAIRAKEQADFVAVEKDLADTIDAIERAISILEKNAATTGDAALLQENDKMSSVQKRAATDLVQALSAVVEANSVFTADQTSKLTALVQKTEGGDMELGAPDPDAYKNSSGGIVEVLEGLLEKAQSQLDQARSQEAQANQNFNMLKVARQDKIENNTKALDKTKKALAVAQETKAVAGGDLAVTSKDLAGDVRTLSELHHDCMTKATDFEEEVKSRGEELKALATAKKIVAETSGGASEQTYDLAQQNAGAVSDDTATAASDDDDSFLQVRMGTSSLQVRTLQFVRRLARTHHSSTLAQLAKRIGSTIHYSDTSGKDVFKKVKGLISDMMDKLLREARDEATEKMFCDQELAQTNEKKEQNEADLAALSAKIDAGTTGSAKLKEEVALLQKELADIAKTQAEMDKVRMDEHGLFVANKAEMEQGIKGIEMALKVLRDYYGQQDDAAHDAADGAGSGIIGLLEVTEADFNKGLSEMVDAEGVSQNYYEAETKDNAVERTTKEQDVKYKTKEYRETDAAVAEMGTDKNGIMEEQDAVLEYLAKVKSRCIAKPETYELRVKRREAEIAGLKEGLSILSGESALLQGDGGSALRGTRAQ